MRQTAMKYARKSFDGGVTERVSPKQPQKNLVGFDPFFSVL